MHHSRHTPCALTSRAVRTDSWRAPTPRRAGRRAGRLHRRGPRGGAPGGPQASPWLRRRCNAAIAQRTEPQPAPGLSGPELRAPAPKLRAHVRTRRGAHSAPSRTPTRWRECAAAAGRHALGRAAAGRTATGRVGRFLRWGRLGMGRDPPVRDSVPTGFRGAASRRQVRARTGRLRAELSQAQTRSGLRLGPLSDGRVAPTAEPRRSLRPARHSHPAAPGGAAGRPAASSTAAPQQQAPPSGSAATARLARRPARREVGARHVGAHGA